MNNTDLKVFIDTTTNYFEEISGDPASLGIPYLLNDEKILLDYTAIIGVSGERRGGIYITTSKELIKKLVTIVLKKDEPDQLILNDMVGEMSNVISGNARNVFGSNFMISVPMVITGKPDNIVIPAPTYAIPITWQNEKAFLVIGLEK